MIFHLAPGGLLHLTLQNPHSIHRLCALELGLIVLSCGIYGNVIRFLAPLTISDTLLSEGLEKLEAALAEVTATQAAPAQRIA